MDHSSPLLASDEPSPVVLLRPAGSSPLFITCDHAGRLSPRALGRLGVAEAEWERHIAWDIGAAAVAERLSAALNATLVMQRYSRLVVDCNRAPGVAGSIATISEATEIPGNQALPPVQVEARVREIFHPYHDAIAAALDARRAAGRPTVLVALHSFTPVYKGVSRPWHIGLLYNRDPRFACILMELLAAEPGLMVGDNEPYFVSDLTDYTVPVHGEQRGLPHIEIEIRQDLVTEPAGQAAWAERLAKLLPEGYRRLTQQATS